MTSSVYDPMNRHIIFNLFLAFDEQHRFEDMIKLFIRQPSMVSKFNVSIPNLRNHWNGSLSDDLFRQLQVVAYDHLMKY